MQIGITIRTNALGSLSARLPAALPDVAQRSAERLAEDWRQHVHVDTGAYRDSIGAADGNAYATVPYAPFQEYGTRFQAGDGGQARQAAEREWPRYQQDVRDTIARLAGG